MTGLASALWLLQQGLCDANKDFGDYLTDFEFIKAPTCAYANETGFLVLGLFVYGGVLMSIYIRTNSPVIPVVLIFVTGGAILTGVAAVAQPYVVLLVLGVPAGVIALAYYVYSR